MRGRQKMHDDLDISKKSLLSEFPLLSCHLKIMFVVLMIFETIKNVSEITLIKNILGSTIK